MTILNNITVDKLKCGGCENTIKKLFSDDEKSIHH
jgi:hypothetical protein